MKKRRWMQRLSGVTAFILCWLVSPSPANAQTLFSDDSEGDLTQWIGKNGGAHSGVIVEDPLRSGNHVLSFTQLVGAGDVFGLEVPVIPG